MPVDPMIARGVEAPDLTRPLLLAEEIKNRRQYNKLLELDRQFRERSYQDEQVQLQQQQTQQQAAQKRKEQLSMLLPMAANGNESAIEFIGKIVDEIDPAAGTAFRSDPKSRADAIAAFRQQLGIEPKQQTLYSTEAGYLPADQAQGKMPYRAPPQPQQIAPPGYRALTVMENGKPMTYMVNERNPADRVLVGEAQAKGGDVSQDSGGLNDRQVSGVNLQRDAALSYAANMTGEPRDEIERIYAAEGPDGVARVMIEKGDRWIQGGVARAVQGIPFVGKGIVEATNADLIAPAKAGGAGIAMYQNPTGPITGPDFVAGEAQFPQAIYPKEVQAEMVRQMLRQSGGASKTEKPAGKFQVGKEYVDANGNRAVYLGSYDGQDRWEPR